jgi:hypothetical protein
MVVRIIYRPSYSRLTVTHDAVAHSDGYAFGSTDATHEREPAVRPRARSQRVALRSLALLLVRLGLGALAMAAWRIASDLGLPLHFAITGGVLSHWQVWFGAAVLCLGSAGLVVRRLQFARMQDARNSGREQAA